MTLLDENIAVAPAIEDTYSEAKNLPMTPTLFIPKDDEAEPLLSIVIPALNEEITIRNFIEWCRHGIKEAGVKAEIIIIDSSTDKTAQIALQNGARVLKTPKRGLGRAYIDAIPFIRGHYVLMGDADCTYDFRKILPFMEKFRQGSEFIMGSRFLGTIEPGAMPKLHQYFGTPLTTFILNTMYGTKFTDIHCGMRGMTLSALQRMNLSSQSWEYASEIILKSVHMNLDTAEVPVNFLKDMDGRFSHHLRSGWFSPWQAGWINLRAMFIYGADFFLMKPGAVLLCVGLILLAALAGGPITIAGFALSLNALLLGFAGGLIGLQMILLGGIAQCIYDQQGPKRDRWMRRFRYTRTTLGCMGAFFIGLVPPVAFVRDYIANGKIVNSTLVAADHAAVLGLFVMLSSVFVFVSMLVMHAVVIYVPLKKSKS